MLRSLTVLLALTAPAASFLFGGCCAPQLPTPCCQSTSWAYAPPRVIGYERIPLYAKVPVPPPPPPPSYPTRTPPPMIILFAILFGYIAYLIFTYSRQIYDLWVLNRKCAENLKMVQGPSHLPLVGSAHLFKWDPYEFTFQMEQWAQNFLIGKAKYGEKAARDEVIDGIMMIHIGPVPVVFLGTPETIRPVLESNVLVNALEKHADSGEFFDGFPYFKRCTLDIISPFSPNNSISLSKARMENKYLFGVYETAMGIQVNAQLGENNDYVHAVKRISEITWNHMRFPWFWFKPFWYLSGVGFEFNRNVKSTNDFTRKVIQERKELLNETLEDETGGKKKRRAFLDLLLTIQREEHSLSDEDIREEVDTFMFEGHDTTASGIGFTILFLGFNPQYQKKLHEELDSVFGSSDRIPTMEDLKKCTYLEKCVKEALRMFPSVPIIARRLSEDVTIDHPSGRKIVLPEGLTACISPIAAARDPRAYKDPNAFNPDNFEIDEISGRDPFAYIPFSAGPRNCIGQKFAILEEKTVLSWFFRKYD